ncbi:MAG: cyclic nucleotide-binding domain-containing protein [Burkholderiales bacterium]|nr:cyclic nucleotide-binding domain-containing protein [Burkholderiales bacterium]
MRKLTLSAGIYWVEIAESDLRILCGCPPDAVKHMLRRGVIRSAEVQGVECETGPNAILLSDLAIQNGQACSRSEFPVLQMLYKQGLIVPDHPNNTGQRPILIGSPRQVDAQMNYIYRGNYGLVSREELVAAGVSPEQAAELMRMKLAFAFGRIRPTEELIEAVHLEDRPLALRPDVSVRRLRSNVFEFSSGAERVEVDLNLAPGEIYECPYKLDNHLLDRDYLSIVHSGDGDGWDVNRPAMGSIVVYQGRIFVVDAGPNIDHVLTALGIGVNEIAGIFHTHAHDDHMVGITSLLQSDHRIAYYAVPMVRASVVRKLESVMQLGERDFTELFDVHDLVLGAWNDVEGLEVMPVLSPHPVETTILRFRVMWEGGYRSYAHLADIASVRVMKGLITHDEEPAGISRALFDRTLAAYLEPADIKKIDIGGGLIHGEAEDFREDPSGKLMLAHTARRLTERERSIGSGAPFGTVDVLIKGAAEVFRPRAAELLRAYFPRVPLYRLRPLMNCELRVFNPEEILLGAGDHPRSVYLVVSGVVEMIRPGSRGASRLSAGSLVGEIPALLDLEASETYRAVSFARVLRLPADLYRGFVVRCGLYRNIVQTHAKREDLRRSGLLADGVSCVTLNRLVRAAAGVSFGAGEATEPQAQAVAILKSGTARLATPAGYEEVLEAGTHFGGLALAPARVERATVRFVEPGQAYLIPLGLLKDVPAARWKLLESLRRRYAGD